MNLFHVLILSIIEGVTEFLPISSTGHLILASHLLSIPQVAFTTTFEIVIQFGAILAVLFLYFKKIIANKSNFYKACIGFLPTGVLGFVLYPKIKHLLTSDVVPVITLFLGGIAIIGIEMLIKNRVKREGSSVKEKNKLKTKNLANMSYRDALIIGLVQSISMIPGVSRSAASIFGGMAMNLDREAAVEFSFLLAIPTMTAATGLDLVKNVHSFHSNDALFLITGVVVSFVVALFVIKWLLKFVQKNNFIGFGIYRIAIAVLYFIVVLDMFKK